MQGVSIIKSSIFKKLENSQISDFIYLVKYSQNMHILRNM